MRLKESRFILILIFLLLFFETAYGIRKRVRKPRNFASKLNVQSGDVTGPKVHCMPPPQTRIIQCLWPSTWPAAVPYTRSLSSSERLPSAVLSSSLILLDLLVLINCVKTRPFCTAWIYKLKANGNTIHTDSLSLSVCVCVSACVRVRVCVCV